MAQLDELYTALRNADAAGDTQSAMKLAGYIRTVQATSSQPIEAPPQEQYQDPAHAGREQGARMAAATTQAIDEARSGSIKAMPAFGGGEAAVGIGSGLLSAIVGGVSALGSIAKSGIQNQIDNGIHMPTRDEFDAAVDKGVGLSQSIQNAGTYQPRSGFGKLLTEVASAPLGMAKQMGREVGGDIGQVAGGDQGRIAGESIGDVLPDVAATLLGGRAAMRGARDLASQPKPPIPGKDFSPLRDLSPEEFARMQAMTDQGIKPTLGQITRDPEQFRFEDQTGKTKEGSALRERELDTNDALTKAIDDTDKLRGGRGDEQNVREAGQIIASALEENAQRSMANVNDLYKAARESGETKAIIDADPLKKFLADNEAEHGSLDVIQRKLDRLEAKNGGALTIDDAETLYKTASDQTTYGDPSAVYMGRLKSVLNDITDGAGGDLYREARQARLTHGMEFEDRTAIARLIEKKSGSRTDYKTASEDVFNKTVVNSSLAELQDVVKSLASADPMVAPKSWQALRELQSQTVDYLLRRATEKGIPNERGTPGFSAPSLREAIKSIGADKMQFLLGDESLSSLQVTLENAKNAKQAPGKVAGSDTSVNLADAAKKAALDAALHHLSSNSKIPFVSSIAKYFEARSQAKALQGRIGESLNPHRASLAEIERQLKATKELRAAERLAAAAHTARTVAPTAFSTGSQPNSQRLRTIQAPFTPRLQAPRAPMPGPYLPLRPTAPNQDAAQILNAPTVDAAIEAARRAGR